MQHLLERVQDAYGPHPAGEFWVPHRLGGGAPTLAEANRWTLDEAAEKAARRAERPEPDGDPDGPSRGKSTWNRSSARWRSRAGRRWGHRHPDHLQGLENIPASGGAVVAINHTGYIDFLPAALAAMHRRRRMRFMIKAEMQDVKIVNFLIKHSKTIPGGPAGRRGRVRGGRRAAARRRDRRRLPGGDHQPQLRVQGVQDRRRADGAWRRRCRSSR